MEKQRQLEWENQQLQKMQQLRQQEQEKLLKLKAQNQTYTIELGSLNDKVKELSQKICDTRITVTSVKSVIDGMRSTRDTQMSEMTSLKAQIKEQNAKLVQLSHEKAKLDSKYSKGDGLSQEIFASKQLNINQLRDKLHNLKEDVDPKEADVNANTEQLNELKNQLQSLLDNCEETYASYVTHRNQVLELKNNKKNDALTSAWDTAPEQNSWSTATETATATTTTAFAATAQRGDAKRSNSTTATITIAHIKQPLHAFRPNHTLGTSSTSLLHRYQHTTREKQTSRFATYFRPLQRSIAAQTDESFCHAKAPTIVHRQCRQHHRDHHHCIVAQSQVSRVGT